MNKPSTRIAVILLVGAAAIAATLLIRNATRGKKASAAGESSVLAADVDGAITQTEDGTVRGFNRAGKLLWTQLPRQPKGDRPPVSNFYCADGCPNAFGNLASGGKNQILRYGFGSSAPGTPLGAPLNSGDTVLRGVVDSSTLVIRRPAGGKRYEYLFVTPPSNAAGMVELSKPVKIPAAVAVIVLTSEDAQRVMIVEIAAAGRARATVRWFQRDGAKFKQIGAPFSAKSATTCMSSDGQRAAVTGGVAVLMSFGGGNRRQLPITGTKMTCTFSPDGVTVSTVGGTGQKFLTLTHFDGAGRQKWTRSFTYAAGFNARDFDTTDYQVVLKQGTLLIDQATGKDKQMQKSEAVGYPAASGLYVRADGEGRPRWSN